MDQYPYSIPTGFQPYAGNASEKSTDVPIGSAVPGQNPYFTHSGAAEVPPFGYVPPVAGATQEHHQQQQLIQPSSVPISAVHANGLMPTGGPTVFNAFNNPAAYGGQFPTTAGTAPMPHMAGIEGMYNQPNFNAQVTANDTAVLYPPVPMVVNPTVADNPVDTVESSVINTIVAPEVLNVGQDANAETTTNKEPLPEERETGQEVVQESNRESTQQAESTVTESTAPVPTDEDSSKRSEEPSQTSLNADANEPSGIENDLPTSNEVPEATHEQLAETSEEPVDTQKSRSPSRSRSLSASTEEVSAVSSVKKKRRRIVTLNDDEDDSEDEDISNRMELLRSPEPESVMVGNDADESAGEKKRRHSTDRDGLGDSEREDDDDRPKSSASGAASIFQNVVMIPAGGDSEAHKRKKIRVLDSDDDEDDQKALVSVDDIGLTGEGADDLNPGGLLVDENADNDDLGTVDGIELDQMEQIVAMDAPIIDPSELANEDDDDDEPDGGENEKETSDREQNGGSEGEGAEQEDEELGEEEEVVEEGVEMIAAEDDDGEAIGIATDDEQELEENVEPEAASDAEGSEVAASEAAGSERSEVDDNRGSDAEEDQASDVERSEAEEQSDNERRESESEKGDKDESEEEDGQNDQSETRSTSSPVEQEKDSSSEKKRKDKDQAKKSDSDEDDDVVCQNVEVNTISLLTDEEDDNMTPLPPPKKELPVVRIVNIKKELLDERFARRDSAASRMDAATSYQHQHYLKRQQQLAQKKREKQKKRSERTLDNNNPFGPWSSSSSDDEFIPNDIYFGTPDRVFTASTKVRCQRQKIINDRYSKQGKTSSRPYKRKYGEEPDAEQRRKQKQKLEEISRLNLPTYQQQQLQTLVKKKKKNRPDRFYDKSQDIPNDIYFGNVNVPLHILHAFGDSSSDDERRGANVWRSTQPNRGSSSTSSRGAKHQSSSKSYKKASSSSTHRSPHSPSNDRSIQAMKEYLKIAGFKNVKFHKLWEGCKSNQERANAILRLMQEKGLEGEPTIAKCRELRKQLQMEREVQVLDTSLIIDSNEGRTTRRSARHQQNQISPGLPIDPNAPSTSGLSQPPSNVPPESLETLNRIRHVIDPDSEGEE
nr:chromatin-remodeling ATPase INO80-like [Aedes albopictus]